MPATATIIPADPALWRQGFLDLRASVVPCPGFTAATWSGVHAKSMDFLDRWADEAAALGWTTRPYGANAPNAIVCGVMHNRLWLRFKRTT